jgi:CRISPR-associated protein Csm3
MSEFNCKLVEIIEINGVIKLETGLHIGAGDTEMHIGGTDSTVVRHPHTLQPYIPGSSLKGKIRSLLEAWSGALDSEKPLSSENQFVKNNDIDACNLIRLFGSAGDKEHSFGPTRISFSDCFITKDCIAFLTDSGKPYTEVKTENTIDRIHGKSKSGLRQQERVVAGIDFDFKINLKIFDNDKPDDFKVLIAKGLKLLQMDALGGSGSRGYGRISIHGINIKGSNDEIIEKEINKDPFEM